MSLTEQTIARSLYFGDWIEYEEILKTLSLYPCFELNEPNEHIRLVSVLFFFNSDSIQTESDWTNQKSLKPSSESCTSPRPPQAKTHWVLDSLCGVGSIPRRMIFHDSSLSHARLQPDVIDASSPACSQPGTEEENPPGFCSNTPHTVWERHHWEPAASLSHLYTSCSVHRIAKLLHKRSNLWNVPSL